jgi:hypothetical protein
MDKINVIISALILFLTSASTLSHASLIDHGGFTSDDVSGLDWLDLSATEGMTVAAAIGSNGGNWQLATKSQFQSMFSQFEKFGDGEFLDVPGSFEYDYGELLSNLVFRHLIKRRPAYLK